MCEQHISQFHMTVVTYTEMCEKEEKFERRE